METLETLATWFQLIIAIFTPYVTADVKKLWGLLNDYAILRALVLMLIGYFIAKFFSIQIPKQLVKLAKRFNFGLGDDIAALLRPLIFKVIFFASIALIAKASSSSLPETTTVFIQSVAKSLIVLFIVLFLNDVIKLILQFLCHAKSKDGEPNLLQPATLPLFENVSLILIILIGVQQIFAIWNIDMTALLASAGLVGLAVGMASKDTLSDIIAGILILTDRPYSVGDIIQIDTETRGKVIQVGIRSTRILKKDNIQIIIPNGVMGRAQVTNESSSEDEGVRIMLMVSTAYGVDAKLIRKLLINAAKQTEIVLQDKKIIVHLSDIQKSHTIFTLFCWIAEPADKSKALAALRENVYELFIEEDIEIALPEEREIAITRQPQNTSEISITQIPDLFGNGQPRKVKKIEKGKVVKPLHERSTE